MPNSPFCSSLSVLALSWPLARNPWAGHLLAITPDGATEVGLDDHRGARQAAARGTLQPFSPGESSGGNGASCGVPGSPVPPPYEACGAGCELPSLVSFVLLPPPTVRHIGGLSALLSSGCYDGRQAKAAGCSPLDPLPALTHARDRQCNGNDIAIRQSRPRCGGAAAMECPASGQAHLKARIIVDEQIEGDKRRLRTRLGETRVLVPALVR